jgi:hypothetical protein
VRHQVASFCFCLVLCCVGGEGYSVFGCVIVVVVVVVVVFLAVFVPHFGCFFCVSLSLCVGAAAAGAAP